MRQEGENVVETPVEARAGYLDRPVAKVLVISTGLVVVLFAIVYFVVLKA
jgi:hypothetical protein